VGRCDKHGANGHCSVPGCSANAQKKGGLCWKHGGAVKSSGSGPLDRNGILLLIEPGLTGLGLIIEMLQQCEVGWRKYGRACQACAVDPLGAFRAQSHGLKEELCPEWNNCRSSAGDSS
jgi:hypothetical protein